MIPAAEYVTLAQPVKGARPSTLRYRALLEHYATRRLVPLERALSRERSTKVAVVRWETWADLHRQGFSLPGIGAAAGRHHTSILAGLRRLPDVEAGDRWCPRAKKSLSTHRLVAEH